MKKNTILRCITYCTALCLSVSIHAQTIISKVEGAMADTSTLLEIDSDSLGVLVPRLTENGRLSIGSPATGLLLFQTDQTLGYRYNQGMPTSPDWVAVDIAGTGTTFFDKRIPMDSVGNGQGPFTINEPGSYYFTKDIFIGGTSNTNGIKINSSYVTIDLNGFSLRSNRAFTGDGIQIANDLRHITIKNGKISDWKSDGIAGFGADNCIYKNLEIDKCDNDGLESGENCLVMKCELSNNGNHGLRANDGNVIVDCVAGYNEFSGFLVDRGSIVENCAAYENKDDGFESLVGGGYRFEGCTAYNNEVHGFDVAGSAILNECNAYRNGASGFDLSNACILENSKASRNGFCIFDDDCENQPNSNTAIGLSSYGNGIRVQSNSTIRNCTVNDNERVGIRAINTDNCIVNNSCSDNENVGIYATSSGSLIVNNHANRNGISPNQDFIDDGVVVSGNFVIDPNCSFGPIINVSNGGNIVNYNKSDHPFANFEY